MYIYIALNSSTNNRRCSSYITYNYSSLSNLYSTFCLYIAINLCVIRKKFVSFRTSCNRTAYCKFSSACNITFYCTK